MDLVLSKLEWLSKYGLIDIIFGIGVISFIFRIIKKAFPSNFEYLHIDVAIGDSVSIPRAGKLDNSLIIRFRNAGYKNIYIARVYFQSKLRTWWTLWLFKLPTRLKVHPQAYRIIDKDAFEVKFNNDNNGTTEYDTFLKPGSSNKGKSSWIPLEEPVTQNIINDRKCGVLFIEYATQGKQGIHRIRV